MLVFLGGRVSYDVSAIFGSFGLFFADQTVSVLNVVHVSFELGA